VYFLLQMCDSLAEAHEAGLIHRDVKPSNVLVGEADEVSVKLLDFGLAQFDDADTLTGVGDVPGTLAYISPERLRGDEASEASDIWAVGVMLWEALSGEHPFWGVPLPQVATAIEAGAPPLASRRPDLPKPLLAAVDGALAGDPEQRPRAAELAHQLREAWTAPTRERAARRSGKPKAVPKPSPLAQPLALDAQLVPAGLAGIATLVGATLLPFWPPLLVALLVASAVLTTLRWPRLGLALTLFAPVLPLGNVAQGAALVYGVLALAWLAAMWRDARCGLAFAAGPLLAPIGLLALVPLAVQPAAGLWRKGLHACVAVLTAALAAGLAGNPLPLTGEIVANVGVAGTERPGDIASALTEVLRGNAALVTTALTLTAAAVLLPYARSRGLWGIVLLGAGQLMFILLAAPSIPWAWAVFGTWLMCALLCGRLAVRAAR
jgi:hypothetical protein